MLKWSKVPSFLAAKNCMKYPYLRPFLAFHIRALKLLSEEAFKPLRIALRVASFFREKRGKNYAGFLNAIATSEAKTPSEYLFLLHPLRARQDILNQEKVCSTRVSNIILLHYSFPSKNFWKPNQHFFSFAKKKKAIFGKKGLDIFFLLNGQSQFQRDFSNIPVEKSRRGSPIPFRFWNLQIVVIHTFSWCKIKEAFVLI